MNTYDDSSYLHLSAKAAGTYTVTVHVSDLENPNVQATDITVTWNLKQGISVGGCIKDAQGNPMNNVSIYFTNKDRASQYCTAAYGNFDSKTSTYAAILDPGVYDIKASYHDDDDYADYAKSTKYLYSQSLSTTQTGYDIQLSDLYKVILSYADEKLENTDRNWYNNNELVGSGSTLYVKSGNYAFETKPIYDYDNEKITGDYFNGKTIEYSASKLKAAINVVNAGGQVGVTKEAFTSKTRTYPAAKNTTTEIELGKYTYLGNQPNAGYFVPAEDGQYQINCDYSLSVYDSDGNKISRNNNNTYTLLKGKKYIIGNEYYYGISLTIYKSSASNATDDAE